MAVGVYEYDTMRGESKKIIESFGRELNEGDVVLVGLKPQEVYEINANTNQFEMNLVAPIGIITWQGIVIGGEDYSRNGRLLDNCTRNLLDVYEVYKMNVSPFIQSILDVGGDYEGIIGMKLTAFEASMMKNDILFQQTEPGDLVITISQGNKRFCYGILVGDEQVYNGVNVIENAKFYKIAEPSPDEMVTKQELAESYMTMISRRVKKTSKEMEIGDAYAVGYNAYVYIGKDLPYHKNLFLHLDLTDGLEASAFHKMCKEGLNGMEMLNLLSQCYLHTAIVYNFGVSYESDSLVRDYFIGNLKIPFDGKNFRDFMKLLKQNTMDLYNSNSELPFAPSYEELKQYYMTLGNKVYFEYMEKLEQLVDDYMKKSKFCSGSVEVEKCKKEYEKKRSSIKRKFHKEEDRIREQFKKMCIDLHYPYKGIFLYW